MKLLLLSLAALVLTAPVRAIELSLEQNLDQRGGVGFVDMQRVFAESPDAATAKESFEGIVRDAEERVNLKRAELLKLQQDLAADKAEREKLAQEAIVAPSSTTVSTSSAPASSVVRPPAPQTRAVAPAAALPGLPAPPGAISAPYAVISSTTNAVVISTAARSPLPAPAGRMPLPAAPPIRATVAPSSSLARSAAPAREASPAAQLEKTAKLTRIAGQVLDLDGKIIALQAEILDKEETLARERSETDRGLVSIEGRKTDQVLVRIYAAISAVAQQAGVSVVVDRSAILYGQQSVDLTDKVLQYLRSSPP